MPEGEAMLSVIAYAAGSTHKVTINDISSGVIVASQTEAPIYDKVTLTAIPNEGYRFKDGSYTITYISQGESVTKNLNGSTFVMPDSDVVVSAQFERVYAIESFDDGVVGLYASASDIAVGESIFVDFIGHGNVIGDSIKVTVEFGAYTENLNNSRVFELNQMKICPVKLLMKYIAL